MNKRMRAAWAGLACLLAFAWPAVARAAEARDLTEVTAITAGGGSTARLQDNNWATSWKAGEGETVLHFAVPAGQSAAGLYLCWGTLPASYTVEASVDGRNWQPLFRGREDSAWHQYVALQEIAAPPAGSLAAPAGLAAARPAWRFLRVIIRSGEEPATLTEVRVLGPGDVPADVQRWSPTVPDADLMMFSAHPDDDLVFFSPVLPLYGGEQGRRTIVVYMATANSRRRLQALNALWTTGVETRPIFAPFRDVYSETLQAAAQAWGREETLRYVVTQLRRYKPEVVVSHDVNGEYGHGAHMLTSWAVMEAVAKAADPAYDPESAEKYGTWQVLKCYIHLYKENQILLDVLDMPLERFGGRTVLEVAEEALNKHETELRWQVVRVHTKGGYDCRKYGLFYTAVGPDSGANDMFENVP